MCEFVQINALTILGLVLGFFLQPLFPLPFGLGFFILTLLHLSANAIACGVLTGFFVTGERGKFADLGNFYGNAVAVRTLALASRLEFTNWGGIDSGI